ncbi:MAG: hypothetical protein GKS00_22260 [Alphaproteobacteria bacterium]|nr:hypothetical protein [Alphaproteobacteria bacterium]
MTEKPVPVPNADTQPFWDACNEERLIVQTCKACGHVQFYPRALCVKCDGRDLDWRDAKPSGKVHTFSIVHRAPTPAFRADSPYVLALIDLDDGFRMMMNVVNCPPENVSIDMAVRIVFEERNGQRLPQAEPASD